MAENWHAGTNIIPELEGDCHFQDCFLRQMVIGTLLHRSEATYAPDTETLDAFAAGGGNRTLDGAALET